MWPFRLIDRLWNRMAGKGSTSRDVDRYFEGKEVLIRSSGDHYHADPECRMVGDAPISDPYYTASLQLDAIGRVALRNQQGIRYTPCQCAFRRGHP